MELTDAQIRDLTPEQITEYEQNPDEFIEKFQANQEKATDETKEEPEQEEDSQETEEDAANGEGEQSEDEEEKEPVILTKNGKGTIPYSTLKELRVENATLKEQLKSLQTAKTDLENLREEKANARSPERRAEIQKKIATRITSMKEDFPDIGDTFDTMVEYMRDLEAERAEEKAAQAAKAKADKEKADAAEEARIAEINAKVREAKENNPDLMHWEQNDPDAWQEAVMQDAILMQTPKWSKKTNEERLEEVVKRVRAIMPDASEPPEAPTAKTKEKAKAKLDKAPARKPTTLSDIKGGANPASEREQLENLSPLELARKLKQMPAQQAAAMRAELD